MHLESVVLFIISLTIFHINCSVVPVAPALRYILEAPQNIRPFAAQVSTFTKGLPVFDAPLAAGVLNPPAIFARNVALPHLAVPHAHPAPVAAPIVAPGVLPAHVLPFPNARSIHALAPAAPLAAPGPVGVLPHFEAPAFLGVPAAVGIAPAPPAHVLPFPNARSIHALAPAAPLAVPGPVGVLPAPAHVEAPAFLGVPAAVGIAPASPANLLPFLNARSIHALAPAAPAPVVEPGVW